jgi:hypothetical protein
LYCDLLFRMHASSSSRKSLCDMWVGQTLTNNEGFTGQ